MTPGIKYFPSASITRTFAKFGTEIVVCIFSIRSFTIKTSETTILPSFTIVAFFIIV